MLVSLWPAPLPVRPGLPLCERAHEKSSCPVGYGYLDEQLATPSASSHVATRTALEAARARAERDAAENLGELVKAREAHNECRACLQVGFMCVRALRSAYRMRASVGLGFRV